MQLEQLQVLLDANGAVILIVVFVLAVGAVVAAATASVACRRPRGRIKPPARAQQNAVFGSVNCGGAVALSAGARAPIDRSI